jgi:hypothetical protein
MFIYMKFKIISFINCLVYAYIAIWLDDNHGYQRKVRGPKKPMEGRLVIMDFDVATGQPRGTYARAFVNHLGYLAWDRLPINAHEWKKISNTLKLVVSNHDKELVWGDMLQHFTLHTNDSELKDRVCDWSMKKIATQF